ncbi:MAG: YcnI family protein [Acidimicrobiales bacterium]
MVHRPTIAARLSAALAAGLVLVTVLAAPALAHVTVEPPAVAPGSFATVAFRVPNERPDHGTVKVRVKLPEDTPIASVSLRQTPGWTATVEKFRPTASAGTGNQPIEAVSTITWEGGRIGPDEFQDFEVSMGPIPTGVDRLYFPTIQIYDGGEEVAWIEKPTNGQEPSLPAPSLQVTADPAAVIAARDAHGAAVAPEGATATSAKASTAPSVVAAATPAVAASSDSTSTALASVGLGVAVVAFGLALAALVIARRGAAPAPAPSGGGASPRSGSALK